MRAILAASFVLAAAATARSGDLIPTDGRFGPLRVASHKVDVGVDTLRCGDGRGEVGRVRAGPRRPAR
jgi:hypothetical protein